METTLISEKTLKPDKNIILKELIYEIIDGQPVYYAGYKEVLNNNKKIQDIMGSSSLQSIIIDLIVEFLHIFNYQNNKIYQILYSELGLHIDHKNNLATDIAIYKKSDLTKQDISDKYITKPPRIVFEIDTKANINDFDATLEYLEIKTKKLIDFGVEKIFWILTKSKKIIVISEDKKWYFKDWKAEISVIDDLKFSLQKLIDENGILK